MADEKSGKLLSDILLDAMCKASHDARRRECEDGYRMAIQAKCDEWALLFKGYIYLWDEKYKLIDASLDGFLTNPPKVLSATHSYNVNYTALCYLLMAHAKRRKAEEFLNWRWKPSGVKVPLKKVTRLLGPAAQTYESLSGNQE